MNKPCFKPDCLAAVSWPELAAKAHYKSTLLAKKLDVSQRTLERFFRKRLQTSPQKYLEKLRQSAAERLVARGMRTKEVAILLEYKQSSHFCRLFKQQHRGIAPRAWRATQTARPRDFERK